MFFIESNQHCSNRIGKNISLPQRYPYHQTRESSLNIIFPALLKNNLKRKSQESQANVNCCCFDNLMSLFCSSVDLTQNISLLQSYLYSPIAQKNQDHDPLFWKVENPNPNPKTRCMCKYMNISIVHSSLMANKRKHTKHDRRYLYIYIYIEREREREREREVCLW